MPRNNFHIKDDCVYSLLLYSDIDLLKVNSLPGKKVKLLQEVFNESDIKIEVKNERKN